MTKTMKIEGMMCRHCEMHTKKALEALDGVISAEVSHTEGTAIITLERIFRTMSLNRRSRSRAIR